MKIPPTLQPLIDATRREVPTLLRQLQIGQVLPARVIDQVQPGLLRLQIATLELLARSPVSIAPGTRLKLEVVSREPLPELRIVREPTTRENQQQAIRSAMARQLPPGEVRQALDSLRELAGTTRHAEPLRQFTGILQQAGIRPDQLNAPQLQRALSQSGLFHEARLASPATTATSTGSAPGTTATATADTKLLLLQLLQRVTGQVGEARRERQPAAGEAPATTRDPGGDSLLNRLIRLIEASTSRIQLQQAASLPADEGQRQAWQLDLPIHLPGETHDVALRVERDGSTDGADGKPAWAVNLVFQFDSIGTLQCRIGLAGERVSTTFWSEHRSTHERVEQRLPLLRDALEAQGLEVVHLAGVLGEPPQPLVRIPMPDTLLDERA